MCLCVRLDDTHSWCCFSRNNIMTQCVSDASVPHLAPYLTAAGDLATWKGSREHAGVRANLNNTYLTDVSYV